MSQQTVGIVLVNFNGMRFMPDCLASLAALDYPAAKIVVVDNALTDGSADWLEQNCSNIHLVRMDRNTGITGGNNAGMEWCLKNGCDFVLLLNNDTVVQPDFLSHMMEHATTSTLIVPKIYFHDKKELINNHFGGFDYWRGIHRDWFYGRPDTVRSNSVQVGDMANTCALLIPRRIIESVGLMDDAYFIYADDTDFIARAVAKGAGVIFVPEAVIYHKESSSSGGTTSLLSTYYCTRNRLYFMRKTTNRSAKFLFFLAYFFTTRLLVGGKYLLQGKYKHLRALRNGIADYCSGKTGMAASDRFN